jgi:hypothetical protein
LKSKYGCSATFQGRAIPLLHEAEASRYSFAQASHYSFAFFSHLAFALGNLAFSSFRALSFVIALAFNPVANTHVVRPFKVVPFLPCTRLKPRTTVLPFFLI